MKKFLKYILTLFVVCNTIIAFAQQASYIFIEGIGNQAFVASIDNGKAISSAQNMVFFNQVTAGSHEIVVTMVNDGKNLKKQFTMVTENASPMGLQLSLNNNDLALVKKELSVQELAIKIPATNKPKKKNFIDKLLGENVDGTDVKQFGLYRQGITDANKVQYAILQNSDLQTKTNNEKVVKIPTVEKEKPVLIKEIPTVQKEIVIQDKTTIDKKNEIVATSKKESSLQLIGKFFTEPSRDNDEVKINHPARVKVKKLKITPVKKVEDDVIVASKQIEIKSIAVKDENKLRESAIAKQKIEADYVAKQLELNKMKLDKERLDAIAKEESLSIEKAKFLEGQKKKMLTEKATNDAVLSAKLAEDEALKVKALELEKKKQLEIAASQKKIAEQKAKVEAAANAKKLAAEKIANDKLVAEKADQEKRKVLELADKIRIEKEAKLAKLEMEKQAKDAKIQAENDALMSKKKLELENKIAAKKIKEQEEFAKQAAKAEKAKQLLAEKKKQGEIDAQAALDKAEKMAIIQREKQEAITAAKLIAEQKEIDAKKEFVAEQAKLELAKLELKKANENIAIENAKKEALEWKTKYEDEQKSKLELEIRTKLSNELNAKMEADRISKEKADAEAKVLAEKAKLTKLDKKIIKVANRPNANCVELFTENELVEMFQKLESKIDDESRLAYSKKIIKAKKCFKCKDLEQLAQSYNTQTGKYGFLQNMFPYVQDNENYELLENVFKYESYKAKVRMEFGGEQAKNN